MSLNVAASGVGQLVLPSPVLDDVTELVVVDTVPVEAELSEAVTGEEVNDPVSKGLLSVFVSNAVDLQGVCRHLDVKVVNNELIRLKSLDRRGSEDLDMVNFRSILTFVVLSFIHLCLDVSTSSNLHVSPILIATTVASDLDRLAHS